MKPLVRIAVVLVGTTVFCGCTDDKPPGVDSTAAPNVQVPVNGGQPPVASDSPVVAPVPPSPPAPTPASPPPAAPPASVPTDSGAKDFSHAAAASHVKISDSGQIQVGRARRLRKK